jgi:hypothetical protein
MPGTAFVTRPSAIFQGFLLGMFIDGAMRWGLDSILQTSASLVGDGATGSPLPAFLTNSTNFASYVAEGIVAWEPISADLVSQGYDSFALLVDDVYKYSGPATNYSLAGLDASLVHYFRCGWPSMVLLLACPHADYAVRQPRVPELGHGGRLYESGDGVHLKLDLDRSAARTVLEPGFFSQL